MPLYDIHVFDGSFITTSGEDFTQPDGQQYTLGVSTVTISPGAVEQVVSVDDPNDTTFDDDDPEPQTLNGSYTISGSTYGSGTIIEAEYLMEVQDSLGTTYYIAAVSLTGSPWNVEGFTVHGPPMPPFGEPLTVMNVFEGNLSALPYTSSLPACFEARTRIATAGGWEEARRLKPGDPLRLTGGGTLPVALVLKSREQIGAERTRKPVRLRAHALGPGCPARDLVVSPQHRIWHAGLGALVPARALTKLPRIGLLHGRRSIDYVHIVLPRHAILLAEGCPAESFWPGPMALQGLPRQARHAIRAAMGARPTPAAPFLSMKQAERALRLARAG